MAQGFTLVEILIVVVILGILAAIVIPQFTSASETAKASSLQSQLQTIRSQLELYQVQHNGDYPTLAQLWDNLTLTTDITGDTTGTDYGPYLQKAPGNPFEDSSTVDVVANAAAGVGWVYDASTGAIKAVMAAQKAADTNMDTTNDVVTY
jgi:general secretion pathway protein G